MTSRRINFFIFDDLNRFVNRFSLITAGEENNTPNEHKEVECKEIIPNFDTVFCVDGYSLSVFHDILKHSVNYRKHIRRKLLNSLENIPAGRDVNICLKLVRPPADILDFGWNYRISKLVAEKQELENSMSWLSTLGGAFSALGDNFEHCAKVAGRISLQQLQIALRLGEPPLVARCKLYMALSLIQQKKLNTAKSIVKEQYEVAKTCKDYRLSNMCKGIWSKLQYTYKIEKSNKICCK
ncbi:UNVERIFIED_CONTAM: hypothetical protein PYX00_009084 [Menopon gallinae]|uniref:Uncharacterized protein n=1 Tax=Menopon gallinae TaxID=328185 RepID=A0AAW2HAK2_9NEOP